MAIIATDLKMYLTGGAANSVVDNSLGGAVSSVVVVDNTLNDLWDDVSGDEGAVGDSEYRCVAVKNTHATLTLTSSKVWIQTNTTSTDDTVTIGLAVEGLNTAPASIANESTVPASVAFVTAVDKTNGLNTGNVPAAQYYAIWIKRVVTGPAAANDNNSYVLKFEGDTSA